MIRIISAALFAVAAVFSSANAQAQQTLAQIKSRGVLNCGSNTGLIGFGAPDAQGNWSGLDVEYCRAIAAAIFNDPAKVKFIPLSANDRFKALLAGDVDVLVRNSTWTITNDTPPGLLFTNVNYYDGQGLMVRRKLGVMSVMQLAGASICVQRGTTTELNVVDYFKINNLRHTIVAFDTGPETLKAYDAGRCDAFTTDASSLYSERLKLTAPDDHMVLVEIISKEPLGPLTRDNDSQWFKLVRWVHFAMLNAEELGVTKANVDQMRGSTNPEIKRLLGIDGKFGEGLGLSNDWAYRIVKHVGNYGESFERTVGSRSVLRMSRGQNALWTKGGLQYAPPIR
ncbi:amino acid ABC transporter substrate-binding protein [Bosea sp. Root483D1]|uniref:amino acid ABC transporter substrate-binding protein n=1 Tax=Bosea sp. Root483D1 TaxID=1736544 RepID=UPI00070A63AF|nr:amino acid ABC transporter substrate-binding protein [Bosea sp. Root483D1]KRE12616.1 amino acid ABC transporter substrate-binding protein [Bosea sp. Root483D1]